MAKRKWNPWNKNPGTPCNNTVLELIWSNKDRSVIVIDRLGELLVRTYLMGENDFRKIRSEGPADRDNMHEAFDWLGRA